MQSNEPPTQRITVQVTQCQRALLDFANHLDADNLCACMMDTLGESILNFTNNEHSTPSELTLRSWYYQLEVIRRLHDIAAERTEEY
ncbi:MAG: hypothetical protein JNM22_05595 [Saprospiraceae bacterium]|nr:hypothetical protein [Saprospiraceae bacterium]